MTFNVPSLLEAKRPVLIIGAGMRHAEKEAVAFAAASGIPVLPTWAAADILIPHRVGTFGTHGTKYANMAVQNADYVLSVGSRLDTKATGSPASSFAPHAEIVMVDIDQAEIDKFGGLGRKVHGVCCDSRTFLQEALSQAQEFPDWSLWRAQINIWKQQHPIVKPAYHTDNPYKIVDRLSHEISPETIIVSDTGCVVAWFMQAFTFRGQRFVHQWNQTPMGCGLGLAIGAFYASRRPIVLVTGDGGLGLGIAEMATIARDNLPIRIVLFNNKGHAMCRQTQRQWLGGEYWATSASGGVATPDFKAVAQAFGVQLDEILVAEEYGVEPIVKFGEALA